MVWALSIETINSQLTAKFLGNDGSTSLGELALLAQTGIPSVECQQKKLIRDVDFSNWRLTTSTEYVQAFGIDLPPAEKSQHQIFEFDWCDTKFVVPALVLMRALFRPERHLLPTLFGIQGLDHSVFLDYATNPPEPIIHAHWGKNRFRCATAGIKAGLTWLTCFPSAGQMTDSIHQHALSGTIGLNLPSAKISGAVYGKKIDKTYFVSTMNVSAVTPTEAPYAFASEHPRQVQLMPSGKVFVSPVKVPSKPEGSIELDDTEWVAIQPILLEGLQLNRLKLDQRFLFDNILQKIHTNTGWKKIECKVGKWSNTQRAYEIWRKNGALVKAVNLLTTMRQPSATMVQSCNLGTSAELECNYQMSLVHSGAELQCHTNQPALH
jgi:hypothetical protein